MSDDARNSPGEEYADQAVQRLVSKSDNPPQPEKKKIVIPSREARTVRTKHDDIPELAEALRKERDRQEQEALIAAGYAPTPVSTKADKLRKKDATESFPKFGEARKDERDPGWVDESDPFDPSTFSAEHEESPKPAPASAKKKEEPKSRVGLLLFILVLVSAGGGAAVYLFL